MDIRLVLAIAVTGLVVMSSGCQSAGNSPAPVGNTTTATDSVAPNADWNSDAVQIEYETLRRTDEGTNAESVAIRCIAEPHSMNDQTVILRATFRAANGTTLATVYSERHSVDRAGSLILTLSFPETGAAARLVTNASCTAGVI